MLPADWRDKRTAVSVKVADKRPFLDIEGMSTRTTLLANMASDLAALGVDHLDVPDIRGSDRRVSRAISEWVHRQRGSDNKRLYAGIRYASKLNSNWECWAVFEETAVEPI